MPTSNPVTRRHALEALDAAIYAWDSEAAAWAKRYNDPAMRKVLRWAGPRESKEPGIQEATCEFVQRLLTQEDA